MTKNFRRLMINPWTIASAIILTLICPHLWATVTSGQLCTAMVGKSYPVTQGYLSYCTCNNTPKNIHAGIDYGVPQGIVVRSVVGGKLVSIDPSIGSVGIDDGVGVTFYLHMRNIKLKNADIGKFFQFGTPIGEVSNVGAKGVHLHVEVRRRTKTYPNPTQPVGSGTQGTVADNTYNPLSYFGN
jgi:murein DD-endopeptidase MepM/ murein hydrolase activator NlpD